MKLAIIGTYWPTYSRNRGLINGLLANQVEVTEFNYIVDKSKLEQAGDLTILSMLQRVLAKVKTSVQMLTLVSRLRQFDALVVMYPGHLDLPITWVLAKLTGKPLIFDGGISLYDVTVIDKSVVKKYSLISYFIKAIEIILLKLPDAIFVDTKQMKRFLHRQLNVPYRKLFVVPIGANDQIYKPTKKISPRKNTQVFFFGLYNPLQGTPVIMEVAKLLNSRKDIHLTMLGEGPLKAPAETFAAAEELTNVSFVGFVPESELVAYINKSDIMLGIFANSSIARRVVANKVYAGVACRKAVITADHPAIRDAFTSNEDLLTCKPEDPKSLAEAIVLLADNPDLRQSIANQGYQTFIDKYSPKKIGHQFIKKLRKIA